MNLIRAMISVLLGAFLISLEANEPYGSYTRPENTLVYITISNGDTFKGPDKESLISSLTSESNVWCRASSYSAISVSCSMTGESGNNIHIKAVAIRDAGGGNTYTQSYDYTHAWWTETIVACKPDEFPWNHPNNPDDKRCYPSLCAFEKPLQAFFDSSSQVPFQTCNITTTPDGEPQKCVFEMKSGGCGNDGSMCVSDFEPTGETSECTQDGLNELEEETTDEEGKTCKKFTSGMVVCPENPEEKCTKNEAGNFICPEGCGWVDGAFFCFDEEQDTVDDTPIEKPTDKPTDGKEDNIDGTDSERNSLLNKILGNTESTVKGINDTNKGIYENTQQLRRNKEQNSKDLSKGFDEITKRLDALADKNPTPTTGTYEQAIDAEKAEIADEQAKLDQQIDAEKSQFESRASSLESAIKSLSPTSAQCGSITLNFHYATDSMDLCPIANIVTPILSWLMWGWLIIALSNMAWSGFRR